MGKAGRPRKQFTREQLDDARDLLGRRVYPSRVAGQLREKHPGLTVPQSYRLIEAAQREVYDSLRQEGKADDPLTAQYVFLTSVIADEKATNRDRIAASAVIIKLLGLHKLAESLGVGDVDAVLATILQRQTGRPPLARAGEGSTNGHPHTNGVG